MPVGVESFLCMTIIKLLSVSIVLFAFAGQIIPKLHVARQSTRGTKHCGGGPWLCPNGRRTGRCDVLDVILHQLALYYSTTHRGSARDGENYKSLCRDANGRWIRIFRVLQSEPRRSSHVGPRQTSWKRNRHETTGRGPRTSRFWIYIDTT